MNKVHGALPIDKSTIRRILIRATNWVGDAVMSMPAFEAVRESFPESHITVLARPWVAPLYESHPAANEVIPYKQGPGVWKDSSEFLRVIRISRLLSSHASPESRSESGTIRMEEGFSCPTPL
jgi:hypothetical protein